MLLQIDIEILSVITVQIIIVLIFLIFLTSRYRKFSINQFVIHLRAGKVKSAGLGGRLFLMPLIDSYVILPSSVRQTMLDVRVNARSEEKLSLNIIAFVLWKVVHPVVAYTAVSWDPNSSDYVETVIKNTAESVLRTTCANMTVDQILVNHDEIINQISNTLQDLTANWGVSIDSIRIKEINLLAT
ncbi:MAG TPA: SPFH domain-containing protein [Candidatus Lokiarchaeia archaeon]|nr:SPFH domain-containing protein [Candidatus Lokiarchaeia archaeon]